MSNLTLGFDDMSINTKIPENFLIYKFQNINIDKPKNFTEFELKYVNFMNYLNNYNDIFEMKKIYAIHFEYLYYLMYSNKQIINETIIKNKINDNRDLILSIKDGIAANIEDNVDALKNNYEPPHPDRCLDSMQIEQLDNEIKILKKIFRLNKYLKNEKKRIIDWRKTAENIYLILKEKEEQKREK